MGTRTMGQKELVTTCSPWTDVSLQINVIHAHM